MIKIFKLLVFLSLPILIITLSVSAYLLVNWHNVSNWAIIYFILCVITFLYAWDTTRFIVYMDDWANDEGYSVKDLIEDQKIIYKGFPAYAASFLLIVSALYGLVFGAYKLYANIT